MVPENINDIFRLLERYPWMAYAALKGLPLCETEEQRQRLTEIIRADIGDPAALAELLGEDTASAPGAEDTPGCVKLSTADTIDAFIARFGGDGGLPPEIARIAGEDEAGAAMEIVSREEDTAAPEPAEPLDEEARARMMIKKGDYEGALDIIMGLNLNNPEKSIYFADQIRFLKKLIINKSKASPEK